MYIISYYKGHDIDTREGSEFHLDKYITRIPSRKKKYIPKDKVKKSPRRKERR